jgi:pimeloyl-ACP methyl ester carboxylesterase
MCAPALGRLSPHLIHGAENRLIPVAMARGLAGEIPEAELIVIAHAGHFALFNQSESAVSAVTSVLARAR